jgi:hypothetical protein
MTLNTLPAPMTAAELTAKIEAGEFTVTRLKSRRPRRADLVMSRVMGSSGSARFIADTDNQTRWS